MPIGAPKSISTCKRFFLEPRSPKQRQYEALRAYFAEELPSAKAARAFGYTPGSFQVMCHRFRREPTPCFFVTPQPGPRSQPKKSAARDLVVELRKRNHSVYEISEALKSRGLGPQPHRRARGSQGRRLRRLAAPTRRGTSRPRSPHPRGRRRRAPTLARPAPLRDRAAVGCSCLFQAWWRSLWTGSPTRQRSPARR